MAGTTEADAVCRLWVPDGYEFFNAAATTVGEIREFEGGPAPGGKLWPDAFTGVDPDAFAAWCRGFGGGQRYVAYVATPGATGLVLGYETLLDLPPPGPPRVE
jgi:hypothetical protein